MKEIITALDENKNVSGYKINKSIEQSYQLFFVHDKLETVRRADTADTSVTVYVNHDGKTGNNTFSVFASTTIDELKEKIAKSAEKAALINDEPYSLPEKDELNVSIPSNIADADLSQTAYLVSEAVESAKTVDGCDVNALEIFVNKTETHVINSNGLDKTQIGYDVMIEAIPTCNGEDESVELYQSINLGEIDEQKITKEVTTALKDVSARLKAKKPEQKIDAPIILRAKEIATLINELIGDANYAVEYSHGNLHSVGDAWQTAPKGDFLTVELKGRIEGSPASSYFDGDGTSLKDVTVIDDGKIVSGHGSNRFAQYLKKTPTGLLPCTKVKGGSQSVKELLSAPYLECVSMSGLQVDLYNDYIGGEIRLAYYFDGKTVTPITGISMSGKISEVLNTIKLSRETVCEGGYFGPEKAELFKMKIF